MKMWSLHQGCLPGCLILRQAWEVAWERMIWDRKNQLGPHLVSLTLLREKECLGSRDVEGWFPARSTGKWKRNRGKLSHNHQAKGRILQNVWLGKESPGASCSQAQTRPGEEWGGGLQGDVSCSSGALSANSSRLLKGTQTNLTLGCGYNVAVLLPSWCPLQVPTTSKSFPSVGLQPILWGPFTEDSFSTEWHSGKCSLPSPAVLPGPLGWKQNKNKRGNSVRIWER